MTAAVIDGRAAAEEMSLAIRARVQALVNGEGILPTLRIVLVGEGRARELYAASLNRVGADLGVSVAVDRYQTSLTSSELRQIVNVLNDEPALDGVVVAMPLPTHLSAGIVSSTLSPSKDVDGITVANAGRLYMGQAAHLPSTAAAILHLLRATVSNLRGQNAVVVGRSAVVGKPVALLLLREDASVTITHSRTVDLAFHTRNADILVVATGQPRLITRDMIKPDAVVVDAGINMVEGRMVGDVDFDQAMEVASAITPVPGGVGPLTNIMLLSQVVENAERRARQG